MGFCTKCGNAVDESVDKFCSSCGTKCVQLAGSNKAGQGLSTNKGDDWLPARLKNGRDGQGNLEHTEEVLGEMINETNRVFGQLGVTVAAGKKVTPGANVPCHSCKKLINGSAVQANGKTYHAQCFTCTKCHDVLAGETFVVRNEQPWCDACIRREKSSNNSSSSTSSAKPSEVGIAPFRPSSAASTSSSSTSSSGSSGLTAAQRSDFLQRRDEGKTSCRKCGVVMMAEGVVTPSGAVYHEQCFVCKGCSKPVGGGSSFVERDGSPYHPQCAPGGGSTASTICGGCQKQLTGKFVRASNSVPYHRECFVCTKCRKDITSTGYTLRDNKPMCGGCASDMTPYIKSTNSSSSSTPSTSSDYVGIRYNQVTREVTKVAQPNCLTSPVKNPDAPSIGNINPPKNTSQPVNAQPTSKFCEHCGTSLNGSRFCGNCGKKAI